MTNLDGGLFTFELAFSPRFPEEQPRAKFLTHFYHHRVTSMDYIVYIHLIRNHSKRTDKLWI